LLVALIFLSACSSTTLLYNRLDTLIGWYVDDYVTLDKTQRDSFDVRLDALLAWHREEELPRYIDFLGRFDAQLNQSLSAEQLDGFFSEIAAAADRLQFRIEDLLIDFGATLRPEQREEFFQALRREQDEQREEWLARTDEAYYQDIEDRLAKNLVRVMGRLNKEQRGQIAAAARQYQRLDALWLAERERWLGQVESLAVPGSPGWVDEVRAILTNRDGHRAPDYAQRFEHNTRLTQQLIGTLINGRTEAQDRKLRRKLAAYSRDFEKLLLDAD